MKRVNNLSLLDRIFSILDTESLVGDGQTYLRNDVTPTIELTYFQKDTNFDEDFVNLTGAGDIGTSYWGPIDNAAILINQMWGSSTLAFDGEFGWSDLFGYDYSFINRTTATLGIDGNFYIRYMLPTPFLITGSNIQVFFTFRGTAAQTVFYGFQFEILPDTP